MASLTDRFERIESRGAISAHAHRERLSHRKAAETSSVVHRSLAYFTAHPRLKRVVRRCITMEDGVDGHPL
jgi:hypothetical protein